MKRREAIKALTIGLPALATVSVAALTPTDVIVVECPQRISSEVAARIVFTVNQVWPDNRVLVFGDGHTVKVMRAVDA